MNTIRCFNSMYKYCNDNYEDICKYLTLSSCFYCGFTRCCEIILKLMRDFDIYTQLIHLLLLFFSLFETHPDVQQSFMPFKGVDLEDLKHSRQLRDHALR